MRKRLNAAFVWMLASVWIAQAQLPNQINLTMESGLSNNYVRTFFKDSQGLMWIGTDAGLDSFDGRQIVHFAQRFKTPLKGAVQSIAELRRGVLIVGSSWGAFAYDIHRNQIFNIDFGNQATDVRSVFTSSNGDVFFATDKGFYELDASTFRCRLIRSRGVPVRSLNCIFEDGQGAIWTAGGEGLFTLTSKTELNLKLPTPNVKVVKRSGNRLYIGTLHGLFVYDMRNQSTTTLEGLKEASILSMALEPTGNLYVGTDHDGVYALNLRSLQMERFNQAASLAVSTIFALHCDETGLLWIGTFDSGVYLLNLRSANKFKTIVFENSSNANVRSLYITPEGEKYVGTRNGILLCLDTDNSIKSQTKGFRSEILTTIFPFPDMSNRLLVGTFGGGITVYDRKTRTISDFSGEKSLKTGTVYKFCIHQGFLWIATLEGLYRYNWFDTAVKRFNLTSITGSNEVFTLHSDQKDKLWIGTKTGACYYSTSENRFIQPEACKSHRFQCTATLVDTKGNAWFCFNKGGVLKLDKQLTEQWWVTKEIGLPENAPSSLLEDALGNIWVGSSKGLFRLNGRDEVHAFGLEDGLTGIGFCPESATLDSNGHLWWSNDKGLVVFLNDTSMLNRTIPPLKMTELVVNGSRYDADTLEDVSKTGLDSYTVRIWGKSNNNLEFRFAALNYRVAGRNQYSFLLEGMDKAWSRAGTNSTVAFSRLKPGSYVLKVKASNNDGIWTPKPMVIRFSIIPYFWETKWFFVLMCLMIASIVLYFTRHYVHRLRARIAEQMEDRKRRPALGATGARIGEAKSLEIKDKLLAYMKEEKPWLNSGLRQADVAKAVGAPVHEISEVLNVHVNLNFSDFINSYRVEEVKKRINRGDTQKYTLTAIAQQSGFSAKSSFQRAFKKATNLTPSDFLRSQGRNVTSETNKPS